MERLGTVAVTALPFSFTLLVVDLLVGMEIFRLFECFSTEIARQWLRYLLARMGFGMARKCRQ